jgi:hypothetical protein
MEGLKGLISTSGTSIFISKQPFFLIKISKQPLLLFFEMGFTPASAS